MAKYRDFDDDYVYDDEEYDDYDRRQHKKAVREIERTPNRQYYNERPTGKKKKKKKKRLKRWVRVLIFAIEVVLLAVAIFVCMAVAKLDKLQINPLDRNAIIKNEDLSNDTVEKLKGYTNILLLGVDARDNSPEVLLKKEENHSDAIIVASINNETKEVKLLSIYRDTLLQIPKGVDTNECRYDKATEAIFYYGVESAMSMVNKNLDLNVEDYIIVNWSALIDMVDAVGGIDLTIDEDELVEVNKYLVDTSVNTGKPYTKLTHAGDVHMDGIQATAYSRVRFTKGSDYRRTERQRAVIQAIVDNAKDMSFSELNDIITAIFDNVATSIPMKDIVSMAKSLKQYNIGETKGFPFEVNESVGNIDKYNCKDPIMAKDLTKNVSELHQFLFGVDEYDPSETVKNIKKEIFTLTGKE